MPPDIRSVAGGFFLVQLKSIPVPITQVRREQIAQRLHQELEPLAIHAASQLSPAAFPGADFDALQQHLLALVDAVRMNNPALFEAHILQASEQASHAIVVEEVAALRKALLVRLSVGEYVVAASMLSTGLRALTLPTGDEAGNAPPAGAAGAGRLAALSAEYLARLLAAESLTAQHLLLDEAEAGTNVRDLYLHVLQPAQREVGELWHRGAISVAEEHYCTAATASVMAQLQPYFQRMPRNGRHLLAACVAGDLHTIGLQMVADFLAYDGWEVSYLGADTPISNIRDMVAAQGVDLLLLAASLPQHVPLLRELVTSLRRNPATSHVRVVVGGHIFVHDAALWARTGADAWAISAADAVRVVRLLFAPERGKTVRH